jgi:Protein of unknown function (DUF3105)
MAKRRRTSGVQRRERASADALNRRIGESSGPTLPDWRLLAIGGVLGVGVIIVALVLLFGSSPSPNAGVAQPDDGSAHVADGANCREAPPTCELTANPYSSLPAASGPHWLTPASWGVYATAQEESQLIHNLEHGGIVIWYDPAALDTAGIAALSQFVDAQTASGISGRFKFILSPWGGTDPLPAPVVASAWRYLLELETADTDAIDEFARARYGRSPEPNGGPGPPG